MSWHDRAEDYLRREAELKALTPTRYTSPESSRRNEILAEFNLLNLPGMLEEVNRDVWGGRGIVKVTDDGRQVSLSAQAAKVVSKQKDILSWLQFEKSVYYSGDTSTDQDGYEIRRGGSYVTEYHRKKIGIKILGYDTTQIPHFIKFSLPWNKWNHILNEDSQELQVKNSHRLDMTALVKSLGIAGPRRRAGPEGTVVLRREGPVIYNPASHEDFLTGRIISSKFIEKPDYENPLHKHHTVAIEDEDDDGKSINLVLASSDPMIRFNIERFIEGVLFASSVSRTPNPIEIAEQEAQSEIERITALIGKVIPV